MLKNNSSFSLLTVPQPLPSVKRKLASSVSLRTSLTAESQRQREDQNGRSATPRHTIPSAGPDGQFLDSGSCAALRGSFINSLRFLDTLAEHKNSVKKRTYFRKLKVFFCSTGTPKRSAGSIGSDYWAAGRRKACSSGQAVNGMADQASDQGRGDGRVSRSDVVRLCGRCPLLSWILPSCVWVTTAVGKTLTE